MNATTNTRTTGEQYAWIGFAMGIACMATLVVFGPVTGSTGMAVMGSSTGAMLGAVWASTNAAMRKKALASA